GYSFLVGQSLMQDRYLAFAQVGLFGLWSVTWRLLPTVVHKVGFLACVGWASSVGLADYFSSLSSGPFGLVEACTWLRGQHRHGDLFLVADRLEVNRLRYYATQEGMPWLQVTTEVPIWQTGHI